MDCLSITVCRPPAFFFSTCFLSSTIFFIFISKSMFLKNSFRNTIRVPNSLAPDQTWVQTVSKSYQQEILVLRERVKPYALPKILLIALFSLLSSLVFHKKQRHFLALLLFGSENVVCLLCLLQNFRCLSLKQAL